LAFLVFFPVVVIVYFLLPLRYRWLWLLPASCYFYMYWKWEYGFLLLFTASIDYLAALAMSGASPHRRKILLVLSLVSNLGVLFFFKYFNFFNHNMQALFQSLHLNWALSFSSLLLPVGISFYTFQSLSYTIDVYRGVIPIERHYGRFLLFVTFFPQLVAGPIERAKNLLPQFYERFNFDYRRITDGLKLMAWGFFKKLVIADRLAVYVNMVYNHPNDFAGGPVWLATYFFAFQIYCDFSGYSDIAIGAAQVMGFKLMDNFRRPYYARSIREFWQRWHISLSTWFKDYLYIPLGGNRVSVGRRQLNIFVVFLVSGLWHGASWTFVVWGALHGCYMLGSSWFEPWRRRLHVRFGLVRRPRLLQALQMAVTFHLVLFSWIFFRANSIDDAFIILQRLWIWPEGHQSVALGKIEMIVALASLLLLEAVQIRQSQGSFRQQLAGTPAWLRWSLYYGLVMMILLFGMMASEQQFIYFQF
jgi:D-alanyl-lipoteichoic acid acyltransferase DltB (MBOAT superfamily)